MRKRIGFDMNGVMRLGSRQTNPASAFGPHDTSQQCPGSCRRIETGGGLGAANGEFSLAGLQIRSVKIRIALPEKRRLASIVAGSKRLSILPDTANPKMILKVPSYTRKLLHNRYPQAFQFRLVANAGLHQHLWGVDRA